MDSCLHDGSPVHPIESDVVVALVPDDIVCYSLRQVPGPRQITCVLCEDAVRVGRSVAAAEGVNLWYVTVDGRSRLLDRYRRRSTSVAQLIYAISSRRGDVWWAGPADGWVVDGRRALRFPSYRSALSYLIDECELHEATASIRPIDDDTPRSPAE